MNRILAVYFVFDGVRGWNAYPEDIELLRELLPEYTVKSAGKVEEFEKLLEQADVALTWKYYDEWVEKYPAVKVIGTPAAGADFLPSCIRDDMKVIRGSFHGITMSETVIGMMLEHSRRISEGNIRMKSGELWPRAELDSSLRNLTGSHVAILGFGAIGEYTARRLKAFDCRITGVKRSVSEFDRPGYFTDGDEIMTFDELIRNLGTVDHLVSFLPDNVESTNLIDSKVFELLPNHAAIYNLGRGNSVCEDDLISAIENREIASAYLDVFNKEPLDPDSRLRSVDEIYLLPHASAISPDYLRFFFREVPDKLSALGLD